MTRRRARQSYGRRQLRRLRRDYLQRYWRLLVLSISTSIAVITWNHTIVDGGYAAGVVDTATVLGFLAVLGLGFLFEGGMFQLGAAWAEDNTSAVLAAAGKRGDIHGSVDVIDMGNRDVDHVLVAQWGIFAIDSKWRFDAELTEDVYDMYVTAARRGASTARLILMSADVKMKHDVHPLVVVWGRGARAVPEGAAVHDGVAVVAGEHLEDWIKRQRGGLIGVDFGDQFVRRLEKFAEQRGRLSR